MDGNDPDREAIDLLVRELTTAKRMVPTMAPPAGSQPAAPSPEPGTNTHLLAGPPAELRPGSRWSNVRVLMPSQQTPGVWRRFADASAARLPVLPDVRRFVRVPGPVAMTRFWVGLGALYCASMSFWPYPRTYWWGLVAYLLCLSLVLVTGIWGARLSWEARLGAAHTIALGTVLWAVTLGTAETLSLT
jgi:hypothetical protein